MPSATDEGLSRLLKIKLDVLRRTSKDHAVYEQEAAGLWMQLEQARKDGSVDEFEVRRLERMHDEVLRVLPDCKRRLEATRHDLLRFKETHVNDLEPSQLAAISASIN